MKWIVVLAASLASFEMGCAELEWSCFSGLDCEEGWECIDTQCVKISDNPELKVCHLMDREWICAPYACHWEEDICYTSCENDYDCHDDATCDDHQCVPRACTDHCSDYDCDTDLGQCYSSCTGIDQCASDWMQCEESKCH